MPVTLSDYLTDLQDLLHDPSDRYWDPAQLTKYVNRARLKRDMDLGGFRNLLHYTLIAATDTYTFATISAGATPTPFTGVILDVVAINLFFVSQRYVLQQMSFTDLNVTWRPYVNNAIAYQDLPRAWARYGDHSIVFGPNPSIAYPIEVDVTATQVALAASTDADGLQEPFCRPVVFYAAYLAKLNERQRDEADQFLEDYTREMLSVQGSRMGTLPAPYAR